MKKKLIYLLILIVVGVIACTVGTTNRVIVNQYGDSDSTKSNTSNIYIIKDSVKPKPKKTK